MSKDPAGYSLTGTMHIALLPPLTRGEGAVQSALEAARKKTETRLDLDLSGSRLRVAIAGGGFLLAEGSELRARWDQYGHILLMPGLSWYRIVAPGAMRALLGERRLDVLPLGEVVLTRSGEGQRRLGYRTRKVIAETRVGKAILEVARLADAGEGGALMCRLFIDLLAGYPGTPVCGSEDVPLHAEFTWSNRGGLVFDATSVVRKLDIPAASLSAPPPAAAFETSAPLCGQRGVDGPAE